MARKLRRALANFQAEQKRANTKASQGTHAEKLKHDRRTAKAARTKTGNHTTQTWFPLEDSHDRTVLLVGEGDFTFALNLIDILPNCNIIASSLDSYESATEKYQDRAVEALKELAELETPILHEIDATQLTKVKRLPELVGKHSSLSVVFNFPHLGNSVSDQDRNVRQHQQLILAFFQQCRDIGAKQVVVSLFDGEPYDSWQSKKLARSAGFHLVRSGKFPWDMFLKYKHQLTLKGGAQTKKAQHQREARIYLWALEPPETARKSKHQGDDSDDD